LNAHGQELGRVAFERQAMARSEEWAAVVRFYNFLDEPEQPQPLNTMKTLKTNPDSTAGGSTLPDHYHLPHPADAEEMCEDCEFFRTAAHAGRRAAEDYLTEERAFRIDRVIDVATTAIVVLFIVGALWAVLGGLFS
jgi:hypothetical protein